MDCNGSFEWGSATSLVQVAVCSAAKGLKVSGNATVHGTVSAPVISVTGQKTIDIENIGPVTAVTFPTVENGMVDWTPFYNIAVANNQVFGSQTINGNANWAIPGGVRWINGDLRVNGGGNLTYSGCVIATGSIRINGGMTHTRLANLPALVSRDSTITMNGAHSIGGLVYAKGDITWNGSGTFTGSILCGGNMTFNGTYGILGYSYCEPNPNLNLTSNQVDRVVVEAWQD
jgi:cytoskeletal protein CcmA (bactofilin family)